MTNTEKYFAKHGCDINADPLRFQTDIMMDKEYNSICFDTGGNIRVYMGKKTWRHQPC